MLGARGYVTVPWYTFLATLCRFDHIYPPGLKQDHLFLPREGWLVRESWKFKVVTFGASFLI